MREITMKFIGLKEVCLRVGLSKTQITEKPPRPGMEEFPGPIYIGYRRLYDEDEVMEWQRKRLENRGSPPPRKRRDKTN